MPEWLPLLKDSEECDLFVRFVLNDLCIRMSNKNSRTEQPTGPPVTTHQLHGIYTVVTTGSGPNAPRVSDRTERVFVSVAAYRSIDQSTNDASLQIANCLEDYLGKSKRGRKALIPRSRDIDAKAQIVRALFYSFRSALKESLLETYVWNFRRTREWILFADEKTLEIHAAPVRKLHGHQRAKVDESLIKDLKKAYSDKAYMPAEYAEHAQRRRAATGIQWEI